MTFSPKYFFSFQLNTFYGEILFGGYMEKKKTYLLLGFHHGVRQRKAYM